MDRPSFSPRLVFGLLVVLVALLFLLSNLGVVELRALARWWPVPVIVLGLLQFAGLQGVAPRIAGLAIASAGGLLLYSNLSPESLRTGQAWGYIWPTLLLLVGISLIARSRGPAVHEGARIRGFVLMSGQSLRETSTAFVGGELTAIMGGYELDLRDAGMAPDGATLEVFALMGGVELRIPEDWTVRSEVVSIMGGVEEGGRATGDGRFTLRIRGFVMMGGVEVRT